MKYAHLAMVGSKLYDIDERDNMTPIYFAQPTSGGGGMSPPFMSGAVGTSFGPVSPYALPVIETRYHYDVSSFESDFWQYGQVSGGNYQYSNYSIDVINQYSWFGNTTTYNVSSNYGYGNWTSAPGYYASSGHSEQSDYAGMHSNSIFGTSDSFVFRNSVSDNSVLQLGELVFGNSHVVIHEGAGVQIDTSFASLENFAFRDTEISTSHFQVGDYASNSFHSTVVGGSQTTYNDIWGNYGHGQTASLEVHDQWSQSGNGYYQSHTSDYSSHQSDVTVIGMSADMIAAVSIDDMSLLLGIGGGGKG
ncbi:MAG: hypothetical protein KBD06_03470 [Candidatus Pacebacteria bacterium]|nr:hypothetical protein [Candidatus Paceibacterota bacterium]